MKTFPKWKNYWLWQSTEFWHLPYSGRSVVKTWDYGEKGCELRCQDHKTAIKGINPELLRCINEINASCFGKVHLPNDCLFFKILRWTFQFFVLGFARVCFYQWTHHVALCVCTGLHWLLISVCAHDWLITYYHNFMQLTHLHVQTRADMMI